MSSVVRILFPQEWTPELAMVIEEKLQPTWSPEQIMGRLRQEGQATVCFKTLYRWLYAGRLVKGVLGVLWHKGKRRKLSSVVSLPYKA
jgi:IS30 family transposase